MAKEVDLAAVCFLLIAILLLLKIIRHLIELLVAWVK
jgi:hypothetical protein